MKLPLNRIYSPAIRLAAAAAVFGLLAYLVFQAAAPEGSLNAVSDLVRPAPFVTEPKPSERLAAPIAGPAGGYLFPLVDSPLYFDVTPPSLFDSITATVRYVNKSGALLEIGALASTIDEQFDLRPAENRLLDSLRWSRVRSGQLTLYEREHRYASIDEFLRRPPDLSTVAVYRAKAGVDYSPPSDQRPAGPPREIEVSLRGRHRLLTYVGSEPLNFTFYVQDMNRQAGADPVIVSVYRLGATEPVARSILADDGNTRDDQRSSQLRAAAITLADPLPGVYQLEFTASNDVFIRKMLTTQKKLVFAERLYLGDHVGYSDIVRPIDFWTGGQSLTARAAHLESLQTMTVAGQPLVLGEPQTRYSRRLPSDPGLVRIASPRRDVLLETDGLFALSREDYFDPLPLTVNQYTTAADLDARHINYVLTSYEGPETDGVMNTAQATFETSRLARTDTGAYRFAVLSPGLGEMQHDLRLASVAFTFSREPLTWRNALSRLVRMFSFRASNEALVLPDGTSYDESPE